MSAPTSFVRYEPSIEQRQPHEDELIRNIVESMARVNRRAFDRHRSAPTSAPLGSIMRVRAEAYERSSRFRHEMNARPRVEPRDLADLPDLFTKIAPSL